MVGIAMDGFSAPYGTGHELESWDSPVSAPSNEDIHVDSQETSETPVRPPSRPGPHPSVKQLLPGCLNPLSLIAKSPKNSRAELIRRKREEEERMKAEEGRKEREKAEQIKRDRKATRIKKVAEAKALTGRWLQGFKAPREKGVGCYAKIVGTVVSGLTISYVIHKNGDPKDEFVMPMTREALDQMLKPHGFVPPLPARGAAGKSHALEEGRKRVGPYDTVSLTKCGECHHCVNRALKKRCIEFSRYLELFHEWLERGKTFGGAEKSRGGSDETPAPASAKRAPDVVVKRRTMWTQTREETKRAVETQTSAMLISSTAPGESEGLESPSRRGTKRARVAGGHSSEAGPKTPSGGPREDAEELESLKTSYALLSGVVDAQMDLIRHFSATKAASST